MSISTASYVAQALVAHHGYHPELPPEAAPLLDAADHVLSHTDGQSLQLLCIIDTEKNPGKTYALSRETLEQVAAGCLKYCLRVNNTQLKPIIQLMYCGSHAESEAHLQEMAALLPDSSYARACGWTLDPLTRQSRACTRFKARMLGAKKFDKLMREPRQDEQSLRQAVIEQLQPVQLPRMKLPYVSCALAFICIAVYLLGALASLDPKTSITTMGIDALFSLGGLSANLVWQGEWWRMLTAPFLHGSLLHIGLNMFILLYVGVQAERLMGHAWFALTYFVAALAGACGTLLFTSAAIGVGASGAIMGILAATYVVSHRLNAREGRLQIQMSVIYVLIPSLIPYMSGVDYAAHIAGALGGVVPAFVLYKLWGRQQRTPPLEAPALVLAVALAVATCGAAGHAYTFFMANNTSTTAQIAPNELMKDQENVVQNIEELLRKYPDDPRLLAIYGGVMLDQRRLLEAVIYLRKAVSNERLLKLYFQPGLKNNLIAQLSVALTMSGQREEALRTMAPACGQELIDGIQTIINRLRLCEAPQ